MWTVLGIAVLVAVVFACLERYWNTHDDWFATVTGWLAAAPIFLIIIAIFVVLSAAFAFALAALVRPQ